MPLFDWLLNGVFPERDSDRLSKSSFFFALMAVYISNSFKICSFVTPKFLIEFVLFKLFEYLLSPALRLFLAFGDFGWLYEDLTYIILFSTFIYIYNKLI
jgi:hypothetical protein